MADVSEAWSLNLTFLDLDRRQRKMFKAFGIRMVHIER